MFSFKQECGFQFLKQLKKYRSVLYFEYIFVKLCVVVTMSKVSDMLEGLILNQSENEMRICTAAFSCRGIIRTFFCTHKKNASLQAIGDNK